MKLTIRDIAETIGVSVTTVSQILNNKGNKFSDKTRKRMLLIANEHHRKSDYSASNVINRHSRTIGVIVPDVTDLFFSRLVESVEGYSNFLGYMIMLCNFRHSQGNEIKYLQEPSYRSVDGTLLATPNILLEKYALNSSFYQKVLTILIDRGLNRWDNGQFTVKEYEGAYQTVSLFIESGHTKAGTLEETAGYHQLEERFNGYRHVLRDHGPLFNGKLVEYGELTVQGGYIALKKSLEHRDIMAILCGSDAMATRCYQAIDELGKKIPGGISVIGLDRLKLSEYMILRLMTAQQPSFDIGLYAAHFLIDTVEFS